MELRPFQKSALRLLKEPIHLLCIAATGEGKSLIYERIAAERGRRTLLISPLVALARQQAIKLEELGIPVTLHSGISPKPDAPVGSGVWIISPESLQSHSTRSRIRHWRPDFLVVDECHCLYEWGDRFRTAFCEIPDLVRTLSIDRSVWLTATLPPDAKKDLERRLGAPLQTLGEFSLPPNLSLEVQHVPWIYRPELLLNRVTHSQDCGIVFVTTREATSRVQNLIRSTGKRALIYHAGLGYEERVCIEKNFRHAKDAVLVATSAFGMGMDYRNLRWSVLWQPPASLLSLAQALGRVGRDRELPASATVFWDEEDFRSLQWLTAGSERQTLSFERMKAFLTQSQCRIQALESSFSDGERPKRPMWGCGRCDFCLSIKSNCYGISTI